MEVLTGMGKYDDIIHLPHHVSKVRPQMTMINRAAQFSPFAAISSYEDALDETARLTDAEIELSEGPVLEINEKVLYLMEHLSDHEEITILYFVPDEKKAGGRYSSVTGEIKKVREFEQEIVMMDGTTIAIKRILSIDGDVFSKFEIQGL